MKKVFLTLLVVTAVLSILYVQKKTGKKETSKETPSLQEKAFVIVIPSYNNTPFCEKNLSSIFSQRYKNYRVIYIDDFSTDHTYEKVKDWIKTHGQEERTLLIHNESNQGALANIYRAVHSCRDDEIIVTVDGDDFLAHEGVLNKLNQVYSDPEVWMTYGNYLDYPSYRQQPAYCKQLPEKVISQNSFRSSPWVTSHLRTFYAKLFKKVRLQDLFYQGRFLPMGWDVAFMMPLLEMSGKHVRFIKDTLYLYNRINPISDHQINFKFQTECSNYVRKLSPYTRLKALTFEQQNDDSADLLIFSYNRPLQLYALLESFQKHVQGLNQITVLYRISSQEYENSYSEVQRIFPHVQFIKQQDESEFQPLVAKILQTSPSAYFLFAVDDLIAKDVIDIKECITAMQATQAWGFFLELSPHISECYTTQTRQGTPSLTSLTKDIFVWQFSSGNADWKYPNSLDMVLYKKEDLEKDLATLHFHNPNTLEQEWALKGKKRRVGLCFNTSKCINIPLNVVSTSNNRSMQSHSPDTLLQKFKEGLKMDISPLFQMKNHSRHVETEISFIPRIDKDNL